MVPIVVDRGTIENLSGCQNCEYKEVSVSLSGQDQTVELSGEDGGPVVTVSIPGSLSVQGSTAEVQVQYSRNLDTNPNRGTTKSAVVDITLMVDGKIITKLKEPVEICLAYSDSLSTSPPTSDLCLAFYDEKCKDWKCEDEDVQSNSIGQLCGDTPHLTSFALLLGGGVGECGEYFPHRTIAWLSLGFIGGAIIVILMALVMIEIKYQRKRIVEGRSFRVIETRVEALSR